MMDGHKQKVGNFRIEPPGLFRGRGDHPKQGKLKKRLRAKDIIINIGKYVFVSDIFFRICTLFSMHIFRCYKHFIHCISPKICAGLI